MKRMKTFLIYALLIAALWIFSNIVIYIAINGTQSLFDKENIDYKQVNMEGIESTNIN